MVDNQSFAGYGHIFLKVCLSLKFDEDLGKNESKDEKLKPKKTKRYQNRDVTKPSEKKKIKKELLLKARQEVTPDVAYSLVAWP